MLKLFLKSLLFLALVANPSFGITIGGVYFDDIGFVDSIGTYGGTWSGTLSTLVGTSSLSNTSSTPYVYSTDTAAYINLNFTNNVVMNKAGNDLAVFEWSGVTTVPGSAGCVVRLTINSITQAYTPYWIEGGTYIAYVNLDDFGIPLGSSISTVQIRGASDPEYVAMTALYSVPEPSTFVLFALVGVGMLACRKRL